MYFAVVIACSYHANGDEALNSKLEAAMKVVDDTLQTLHKRWDIDNYPRFLKAVTMTHTSWEVMKVPREHMYFHSHMFLVHHAFNL
jgi:radical SAM superfamily enzyme